MICHRCRKKHNRKHGYCKECHSEWMKEWRKKNPITEKQRLKSICRSYANVYQRRGELIPKPCEVCGNKKVWKFHEDYSKPLEVRWFCKDHHRIHRRKNKE